MKTWVSLIVVLAISHEALSLKGQLCHSGVYKKAAANDKAKYYSCKDAGGDKWGLQLGTWELVSCMQGEEFVESRQKCINKQRQRKQWVEPSCGSINVNPSVGQPCNWQTAALAPMPQQPQQFMQCQMKEQPGCGEWTQQACPFQSQFQPQAQLCTNAPAQPQACGNQGTPVCGCGPENSCPGSSSCVQDTCCQPEPQFQPFLQQPFIPPPPPPPMQMLPPLPPPPPPMVIQPPMPAPVCPGQVQPRGFCTNNQPCPSDNSCNHGMCCPPPQPILPPPQPILPPLPPPPPPQPFFPPLPPPQPFCPGQVEPRGFCGPQVNNQPCPSDCSCNQGVCCPQPLPPPPPPRPILPPLPPPQPILPPLPPPQPVCPGQVQPRGFCGPQVNNQPCPSDCSCNQGMCCPQPPSPRPMPRPFIPPPMPRPQVFLPPIPPPQPLCPGRVEPRGVCGPQVNHQPCPSDCSCNQGMCCPQPPPRPAPRPFIPRPVPRPMPRPFIPRPMPRPQPFMPPMPRPQPFCPGQVEPRGFCGPQVNNQPCPSDCSCNQGVCCPQPLPPPPPPRPILPPLPPPPPPQPIFPPLPPPQPLCPGPVQPRGYCGPAVNSAPCPQDCSCNQGLCCPQPPPPPPPRPIFRPLPPPPPPRPILPPLPPPQPVCPQPQIPICQCASNNACPTNSQCNGAGTCCGQAPQPWVPPPMPRPFIRPQPIIQPRPIIMPRPRPIIQPRPQPIFRPQPIIAPRPQPFFPPPPPTFFPGSPCQASNQCSGQASCQQNSCQCQSGSFSNGASCMPSAPRPMNWSPRTNCNQFGSPCSLRFSVARRSPVSVPAEEAKDDETPLFYRPREDVNRTCTTDCTCTPEEVCVDNKCVLRMIPGEYGCEHDKQCQTDCASSYCHKKYKQCLCKDGFAFITARVCLPKCPKGTAPTLDGRCKLVDASRDEKFWNTMNTSKFLAQIDAEQTCGAVPTRKC